MFVAVFVFVLMLALSHSTHAFPTATSRSRSKLVVSLTKLQAYIPDGLTAEEYNRIKDSDKTKLGKNLGRLGPRGFESRSLQAWQQAMDQGEAGHKFAPLSYKKKLSSGQMRPEEIPYMVRGGKWDNSDIKGAKKLAWSKKDKEYAAGGYKKEQSVSILGNGPGFDWTGSQKNSTLVQRRFPGFF